MVDSIENSNESRASCLKRIIEEGTVVSKDTSTLHIPEQWWSFSRQDKYK